MKSWQERLRVEGADTEIFAYRGMAVRIVNFVGVPSLCEVFTLTSRDPDRVLNLGCDQPAAGEDHRQCAKRLVDQLFYWRPLELPNYFSVDGVPWEIHKISAPGVRADVVQAYLKELNRCQ